MKYSAKMERCGLSPMRKFAPYAVTAEKKGRKIYHLNIGQPDIETPSVYFDAVKKFSQPVLAYAPSAGVPELLDAIRDYYGTIGAPLKDDNILISTGGSEALQMVLSAILDEGDEIIIPEPFYPNYNTFVKSAGGRIRPSAFPCRRAHAQHRLALAHTLALPLGTGGRALLSLAAGFLPALSPCAPASSPGAGAGSVRPLYPHPGEKAGAFHLYRAANTPDVRGLLPADRSATRHLRSGDAGEHPAPRALPLPAAGPAVQVVCSPGAQPALVQSPLLAYPPGAEPGLRAQL